MFDVIAFDADDTLWHSEILYIRAQDRFTQLMAPYQSAEQVAPKLHEIEMRNLPYYGYGIKGFALSLSYPLMIVTKADRKAGPHSGIEPSGHIEGHDRLPIGWGYDIM